MLLIDNSFYTRNSDAIPSRFQAQLEGVTSIVNFKSNDNPETSFGAMYMSGKGKQILMTPTNDPAQIFAQFSKIPVNDFAGLTRSIQIARLAMKHRVNKNQHERLVIFIASAIRDNPEDLYVLARNLRRDGTNVDLINICCPENAEILKNFHDIVNVEGESRLINYFGGVSRLNDALKEGGVLGGHVAADGGFGEETDPEMEMVIRISLEEERKRQEELDKQRAAQNANQMQIEELPKDEEQQRLLGRANQVVKEADKKAGDETKSTQLSKDPKLIEDILKELNLKKKDEDGKPDSK